jgi:hypothetical protein
VSFFSYLRPSTHFANFKSKLGANPTIMSCSASAVKLAMLRVAFENKAYYDLIKRLAYIHVYQKRHRNMYIGMWLHAIVGLAPDARKCYIHKNRSRSICPFVSFLP